MFLFIVKYDWLSLRANRLLLLLATITAFILLFALYDGYQRVAFQQRTLAEIQVQQQMDHQKYEKQIADIKPGKHFDGGHFGDPTNPFYFGNRMGAQYAVLPPAPLAIISTGQSDMYPYYYKVTLSKKQALYHNEELENPQVLFNGRFDVSFVVIFLLPLLIIAFTYNLYAAEKENGTLPLLMAQNMSVGTMIAYRSLFRYFLFNVYFTALLLAGIACFGGLGAGSSIGVVIGIIWLYTGFWFALSYLVNSFKKHSGFSATALTGVWLLLVLIIPTVISTVTDVVYPMPSRLELIAQTRDINDSIAKNNNALNRFLEDHPEFKPAVADLKDRNPNTLRNRIEAEMMVEKIKAGYYATAQKREALINNYRFLSPAIFMQQLLNKAAGTNDGRYQNFNEQVGQYQQTFRDYFEPMVYRQQKFTTVNLKNVPRFVPQQTLSAILDRASLNNVIFLACMIGLVLLPGIRKAIQRRNGN